MLDTKPATGNAGASSHNPARWGASDGGLHDAEILVLVYLFRDQKSKAHAYSVDVTGRNLPQRHFTKWIFVTVISDDDILEREEGMLHLRRSGFYLFERWASRSLEAVPAQRGSYRDRPPSGCSSAVCAKRKQPMRRLARF
jgi:hypothetical protein